MQKKETEIEEGKEIEKEPAGKELLKRFERAVIPIEILNFFSDEQGKTLLVKGPPGTGKTAFALSLLHHMKGTGVYLSTRVDPETLHEQYPWIKAEIPDENIVDATQSERPEYSPSKESKGFVLKALKYTDVPISFEAYPASMARYHELKSMLWRWNRQLKKAFLV